jgi:hypothetical protein
MSYDLPITLYQVHAKLHKKVHIGSLQPTWLMQARGRGCMNVPFGEKNVSSQRGRLIISLDACDEYQILKASSKGKHSIY